MPIYDVFCKNCGYEEEVLVKSSDKSIKCPMCDVDMEKKIGGTNFKFGNAELAKHKRKYGNSNEVGVPNVKDNGVKMYGRRKSK